MARLMQVEGLTVVADSGRQPVVDTFSVGIDRGESVGLVGESGCGKTVTAMAILGLLPSAMEVLQGRVMLDGVDLVEADERTLRDVRGGRIGLVPQNTAGSLNPILSVGFQLGEVVRRHRGLSRREAEIEAARLLELVAMPDPARHLHQYPYQLSGGMRQRAVIAMALAGSPDILIADEPTTALDATIQAEILELLVSLRSSLGLAVVLITHDLGVIAQTCDRVLVMHAGRIVESGPVRAVLTAPAHPCTRWLLGEVEREGKRRGDQAPREGSAAREVLDERGCRFRSQCGDALESCLVEVPAEVQVGPRHTTCCFLHDACGAHR